MADTNINQDLGHVPRVPEIGAWPFGDMMLCPPGRRGKCCGRLLYQGERFSWDVPCRRITPALSRPLQDAARTIHAASASSAYAPFATSFVAQPAAAMGKASMP
jgi:hypothetical protein